MTMMTMTMTTTTAIYRRTHSIGLPLRVFPLLAI